jgi:hypothetical protein
MVGSASEAGQLLKTPDNPGNDGVTDQPDGREPALHFGRASTPSLIVSVTARDDAGAASFCDRLTAMRPARLMDRRNSRSAA